MRSPAAPFPGARLPAGLVIGRATGAFTAGETRSTGGAGGGTDRGGSGLGAAGGLGAAWGGSPGVVSGTDQPSDSSMSVEMELRATGGSAGDRSGTSETSRRRNARPTLLEGSPGPAKASRPRAT